MQYRGGSAIFSFGTEISIHKNFSLFNNRIAKIKLLRSASKKSAKRDGEVSLKPVSSIECTDKKCTLGKTKL